MATIKNMTVHGTVTITADGGIHFIPSTAQHGKLEDWRFNRAWVTDQWKAYLASEAWEKHNVIDFTVQCIDKIKEWSR
jgi:hypothetical protein